MRILLTDGGERAALAAARALLAAGHDVHVAAAERYCLAGLARGVASHQLPHEPMRQPALFAHAVASTADDIGAGLVMPITDASVAALLEFRHHLPSGVQVPLPSLARFRLASDKVEMLDFAAAAGFDVPASRRIASADDPGLDACDAWLPGVVKPASTVVTLASGARQRCAVRPVRTRREVMRVVQALPAEAFPVLLQRRVDGPGEGVFLLRWDGRIVAAFAHRRLREKPPSGGVSVYRESVALTADMLEPGRRLLDALHWQGVAMVECKRDVTTGRPVFMEVNGRLWGSLQLAVDAGVNFPALLVECSRGARPDRAPTYRVGVRSRWFWGEVDHLLLAWRDARACGAPLERLRRRLHTLASFVAVHPGRDRSEIFRWSDPLPFLLESAQWFGALR